MIHRIVENDDGALEQILDEEGIDYLIDGLELLRLMLPGEMLSTPTLVEPGEDTMPAVSEHILRRA